MEQLLHGHPRPHLHQRAGSEVPSFSSSLLDAIFHSIDVENRKEINPTNNTKDFCSEHAKQNHQQHNSSDKLSSLNMRLSITNATAISPRTTASKYSSVSSLSSTTSSAGFLSTSTSTSSSDADSIRPQKESNKERRKKKPSCGAIRSHFRDLRKKRTSSITSSTVETPAKFPSPTPSSPVSPGVRLAKFLNSIFISSGNSRRKVKTKAAAAVTATSNNVSTTSRAMAITAAPGSGHRGDESARSSTSSTCRRSCLSKTPPSLQRRDRGKRSVRFCPVSTIVDEDCRPCGHLQLNGEAVSGGGSAVVRVEELLRVVAGVTDDEEEFGSESSSDLFELEDLSAIGGGGVYSDELPVYETTDVGKNRAIAQGLMV